MMDSMSIEAIRSVSADATLRDLKALPALADPEAVSAFADAMGSADVTPTGDVPFVDQVKNAWNVSQLDHQAHMHRMEALSDLAVARSPSVAGLSMLQYEVASTTFQMEVTTLVAKKASDAVTTLVKNG